MNTTKVSAAIQKIHRAYWRGAFHKNNPQLPAVRPVPDAKELEGQMRSLLSAVTTKARDGHRGKDECTAKKEK